MFENLEEKILYLIAGKKSELILLKNLVDDEAILAIINAKIDTLTDVSYMIKNTPNTEVF